MQISYDNYSFKLKVTQNQWDAVCRNVYTYMKYDCSNQGVDVFKYIEKMYKITPKSLKIDESKQLSEVRSLTIYLLANYSFLSLQDISNDFKNITIDDLKCMKNDKILDIKYEEQTKIFFDYFKEDYLEFIYQYMAKCEDLSMSVFFKSLRIRNNIQEKI